MSYGVRVQVPSLAPAASRRGQTAHYIQCAVFVFAPAFELHLYYFGDDEKHLNHIDQAAPEPD